MFRSVHPIRRVLAPFAALATTLAAQAQLAPAAAGPAPHDAGASALHRAANAELENFYLACNAAALHGRLGHGEIALCSQGYELLLQRRFHGDFLRLLAWSRQQAIARGTAR